MKTNGNAKNVLWVLVALVVIFGGAAAFDTRIDTKIEKSIQSLEKTLLLRFDKFEAQLKLQLRRD